MRSHTRVAFVFALALPGASVASPGAPSWSAVALPSGGPARVLGSHGAACLVGAVPLPLDGEGYQAVDISRRRHFGHPLLVAFITDLGRAASDRKLGTVLVGDMAQPRGGPMAFGHVSHQAGLDVDLWYRLDLPPLPAAERERIAQPVVVDASGRPDPARWTERHAQLVRLAAIDPRVSRVFVGAAIKRDLCARNWPDRSWLRAVRPWPGHDDHLHVRLRCPPESPACVDQPALPVGDGCGEAELALASARERAWSRLPAPRPSRRLPVDCDAVLRRAD